MLEITGQRTLTSRDFPCPTERGPNGRKRCCWCHEEMPPRKQRFCSSTCASEYQRMVWPSVRRPYIHARDGWACQLCGTMLPQWADLRRSLWWVLWHEDRELASACVAVADELDWPRFDEPYEVDHIVALVEGGSNHPSNLRTLCEECHRIETAALRRRLAAANRRHNGSLQISLGV